MFNRLMQLTPASLYQVRTDLADAIAALRQDVGVKLPPLEKLDPAASDFAAIVGTINENVLTLEVLVKAVADIEKLEAAANKIVQRVWTRIGHRDAACGDHRIVTHSVEPLIPVALMLAVLAAWARFVRKLEENP